ncbi:MAG: hypothetical protein LBR73_02265 [Oscillospiraceae bacterium]|jgi:hypothetical protein|nr:hypothetical protein [Oscillospiraceae bacterium]
MRKLAALLIAILLALSVFACGSGEDTVPARSDEYIPLAYDVYYSAEGVEGHAVTNLNDGNSESYYLGEYPDAAADWGALLIFDLGQQMENVARVRITPAPGTKGRIRDYRIYAGSSKMEGMFFTNTRENVEKLFTWRAEGQLDLYADAAQTITFAPVAARYIALAVPFNAVGGKAIAAAEIEVLQGEELPEGYMRDLSVLRGTVGQLQLLSLEKKTDTAAAITKAAATHLNTAGLLADEELHRLEAYYKTELEVLQSAGSAKNAPALPLAVDAAGNFLRANGGSLYYDANTKTYYLYGEEYSKENPSAASAKTEAVGIRAYSSKDLRNWTNAGLVLPVFYNQTLTGAYPDMAQNEKLGFYNALNPSRAIRDPQVLYNAEKKQYILYFLTAGQTDDPTGITSGAIGIATADKPQGPFLLSKTIRLPGKDSQTSAVYGFTVTAQDGKASVIYTADEAKTLYALRLDNTWTAAARDAAATDKDGKTSVTPALTVLMQSEEPLGRPIAFQSGKQAFVIFSNRRDPGAGAKVFSNSKGFTGEGKWVEREALGVGYTPSAVFPLPDKNGNAKKGKFILLTDYWEPYNMQASQIDWKALKVSGGKLTVGETLKLPRIK